MLNILIVNGSVDEGHEWTYHLKRKGYEVLPQCHTLSEMVHMFAQNEVDIAICSSTLIGDNALSTLNACGHFFPRVKIILIGAVVNRDLILKLKDVVLRNEFGTDIEKYLNKPSQISDRGEMKKTMEQLLALLLDEHFLTTEEAAGVLGAIDPNWQPNYITITIMANSYGSDIMKILEGLSRQLKYTYLLQMSINEFCIFYEGSPPKEYCLLAAETIQTELLKRTGATFSIGISRARQFADELYACRKESLRAASSSCQFGKNSVVHIDYIDNHDIIYIYPEHKEKKLIQQIMDGDRQGSRHMLEDIFNVLRRRDLSQHIVNIFVVKIIAGLNIAAVSKSTMFEKMNPLYLPLDKFLEAKSHDESYALLKAAVDEVSAEMNELTNVHLDAVFAKLLQIKKANSNKKEKDRVRISDLTLKLNTTIFFLNAAIQKNSDSNIFEFFNENC